MALDSSSSDAPPDDTRGLGLRWLGRLGLRRRGGIRGRGRGRSSVYVFRVFLEVVAIFVVIFGIFVGVLVWWLYENPTEFTLLGSGVERALGRALGGQDARVESVRFSWRGGASPTLRVLAEGVEVADGSGSLLGRLESVDGVLSLRDLFRGRIYVSEVGLRGLVLPVRVGRGSLGLGGVGGW
ncbi:MAG: hypothetical protein OD811_05325 [Alphaproteobacteria bacterium]